MPELRYLEAVNQALLEEMERDERVFLFGEDVGLVGGTFRVTEGLMAEFGSRRVRDTPIAEAAIVGIAIGAAMAGMRPIAELMTMNFSMVAMDQIVNHASKMHYMFGGQVKLPLVIRAPGGGGSQKGAQHSHSIESWFVHSPGIRVVVPATLPDIATGMRLGWSYSFGSMVAAELIAANSGLGYMIMHARELSMIGVIVFGILLIGAINLFTDYLIQDVILSRQLRWHYLATD